MKYLFYFVVAFVLVSVGSASDLAEVSKKEKSRREALAKQGVKSKVLTNADVSNLKSTLAMESTGSQEIVAETPVPSDDLPPDEVGKQEEEEKAEKYREEIEKTKQELAERRKQAEAGGPYRSRNIGSQYRSIREDEELLEGLEEDLEQLGEDEKEN